MSNFPLGQDYQGVKDGVGLISDEGNGVVAAAAAGFLDATILSLKMKSCGTQL